MVQFFNNIKYTAIFFIMLLVFASSCMALFPSSVLCISGKDHVAIEFEHDDHVPLFEFSESALANSQSILEITPQQGTGDRCSDTPIPLSFLKKSVTSFQPIPSKFWASTYGMPTSLSRSCLDALYVNDRSHLRSFQTSTSLSIQTKGHMEIHYAC